MAGLYSFHPIPDLPCSALLSRMPAGLKERRGSGGAGTSTSIGSSRGSQEGEGEARRVPGGSQEGEGYREHLPYGLR